MARDVIAAGVLGVLAVIVIVLVNRAIVLGHRYLTARGYEFEYARHTAAAVRAELDAQTQTYGTVAYAPTRNSPPWPVLEPAAWQSDIEASGGELPEWARPDADRVTAYGMESGSSGSDYHGGALPAAAEGDRPPPVTGGPGSEPYGVPGPVPLSAPLPGTLTSSLAPFIGDDPAMDEKWDRLMAAWSREGSAGTPLPAERPDSGAVERGREDEGSTGTATRETLTALGSPNPLGNTGRGGAVPVTAAAAPVPGDAAAAVSPGTGSRLATRFDVELAAECARYIREQNKDVTEYLERLLGITW